MALKVGITGGIGSGKTTACQIFEQLGIPVYYADQRAKDLMVKDAALVSAIQAIFGAEAYDNDGSLNRKHIAAIAFSEPDKLQQLNALVHPAVAKDSMTWHAAQTAVPYTLKEAALLYESGSHEALDYIIVVTAPQQLRIDRVVARDQTTSKAVRARMDQQMPERKKIIRADYLIFNDGDSLLTPQIMAIHKQLVAKQKATTHDEI